jgi:hypothetical protein
MCPKFYPPMNKGEISEPAIPMDNATIVPKIIAPCKLYL